MRMNLENMVCVGIDVYWSGRAQQFRGKGSSGGEGERERGDGERKRRGECLCSEAVSVLVGAEDVR